MQITNKQQIVAHKNTIQGEKVVGASNGRAKVSLSKGFSSTPAATFKNSTKDDYDASTLNPLQKRVLSLQEQITNLNSDEKMDNDTKNSQLKSLQEELESVQEQMVKQQEDAPITDTSPQIDSKDEATVTTENTDTDKINSTENNDKSAEQQQVSFGKTLQMKSSSPVKSSSAMAIYSEEQDWYSSQEYKDLVEKWRKEGYTDEQIYYDTHVVEAPGGVMGDHMHEITGIVKDVCDKYGFDYYERRGHEPDMEAILKKNGKKGKSIYEAMSQAFSDFEKTIWQQTAKDREGFSFTHDNGYEGAIWKIIIPSSADPNKSRDPLSFIK